MAEAGEDHGRRAKCWGDQDHSVSDEDDLLCSLPMKALIY